MSDSWPEPDELAVLFRGLCSGDTLAQSDFLVAVLDPLVGHLRRYRPGADEHAYLTAAEDAVLALVRNPAIYDPAKRGLIGFLRMSAERDLFNALTKEARHHRNREPAECVELAPDARNPSPGADLPSFDDPDIAAEVASLTPTERAVLDLMRAGERATTAFAAVLGIGHLPVEEQACEVKRVKDRVIKRLQRAGGEGMSAALDHLAARVATDPLFLANALAEYARSEGLDDAGLAAALGCPAAELTRLRLCGAPRPDAGPFRADIAALAGRFGLDPNALTTIVRRGQSLARLRAAQPGGVEPGFLLAARDDDRDPPPTGEGEP